MLDMGAAEGDLQRVREAYEEGVDLDTLDENGELALGVAAFNGHADVVLWLVSHGASVNAADEEGDEEADHRNRSAPERRSTRRLSGGAAHAPARASAGCALALPAAVLLVAVVAGRGRRI